MHAIDPRPSRIVVAAVLALALAMVVLLLPAAVSDVNLSFGTDSERAAPSTPAAGASSPAVNADWLRDPLASPLHGLTRSP